MSQECIAIHSKIKGSVDKRGDLETFIFFSFLEAGLNCLDDIFVILIDWDYLQKLTTGIINNPPTAG